MDGLNDDFLRFRIGLFLGFVNDVLGLRSGHGFRLCLDLVDHGLLGIVGRHAAQFFQRFNGLGVVGVQIFLLLLKGVQALGEFFLVLLELAFRVFVLVDRALKVALRAFDSLFPFVEFAVEVFALVGLLFLELDEFLFGLEDFLFLDRFSSQFSFSDNAVSFACKHAKEQHIASTTSEQESGSCGNDWVHGGCQLIRPRRQAVNAA